MSDDAELFPADILLTAVTTAAGLLESIVTRGAFDPSLLRETARELRAVADRPAHLIYELRRGTYDDPDPMVLGHYLTLAAATEHGLDEYHDHIGHADQLAWYPGDDETTHHLYATNLGDEVETEWYVVSLPVLAAYDPEAEG